MTLEKKIKSLSEFIEFVNNQEHRHIAQWLFRGHGDSSYKLVPSLFRIDREKSWAHWDRIEEYIMQQFEKESIPYIKSIHTNKIEWLTMAQHYGLPTRLLD